MAVKVSQMKDGGRVKERDLNNMKRGRKEKVSNYELLIGDRKNGEKGPLKKKDEE